MLLQITWGYAWYSTVAGVVVLAINAVASLFLDVLLRKWHSQMLRADNCSTASDDMPNSVVTDVDTGECNMTSISYRYEHNSRSPVR